MAKKKRHQRKKTRRRQTDASGGTTISVCMIAKDEAEFLKRCLESIQGLAYEVVVADTGSSDNTREVARAAGARVIEAPWEADFARARNVTLAAAKGAWVLVLDCDEVLARRDWDALLRTISGGRAQGYRMTTRNYVRESNRVGWQACKGSYAEEKDYPGWFPTTKVRLFRNDPIIRFEGAVHELVEGRIQAIGGTIGDCPVPVHHYGYVEKDRPVAAYAEAAARKAAGNPENAEAFYELALARRDARDMEGAQEAAERCIALLEGGTKRQGHYLRRDFVFVVYGQVLGKLGDVAGEENAYHRALKENPACYQALNNLGALAQNRGDLTAALRHYEQALALAPEMETIRENVARVKKRIQAPGARRQNGGQEEGSGRGGRLSLCMIVRNEAARLGRCLDSVKGLADEMVVVDTGSSDETVAVAERYGAKVGYFEWCDDFAAARNASLKLATGDWVLWLDADDVLPEASHAKVRTAMRSGLGKRVAYYFVLNSEGYERSSCLQMRLFPNLPGVEFSMPIHEQVTPSLARLGVRCEATDIRVVHTGYTTPDVVRDKQKRYLGIMERWLETHPGDYIVRSHAAMTYYIWGELDLAIAHYEKILRESDCRKDRNLVIETTALLYLGRCHMRKRDYQTARPLLLEARKLDDQYAVTNVTLGECYTKMGAHEKALEALERARAYEDQETFAANDREALKYSIRFFTGQNLEAQGRLDEASDCYRQASEADPNRSGALGALSTVLRKLGRREEAVVALEEALERNPDDPKHRFNRGTFYLESGDLEAAERWLKRALDVAPEMPEPYLNLGSVARRRGDLKTAEEMYRKAVALDTASYEPLANLGHLLLDLGRYGEAGEALRQVQVRKSGLLDIDLGLCAAYAAEGRVADARDLACRAVRAVYGAALQGDLPQDISAEALAQVLAECGYMLLKKQIAICARLAFLAAHLLSPDSMEISLQLAEVYRATNAVWQAVAIYEALIQKVPTVAELFQKLGDCYKTMGAHEAARMCSERVAVLTEKA